MLDINLIRENPEVVRAGMRKRGMDPAPVDQAIVLDEQWRDLIQEVEALKAERNTVSKEIGRMKDQTERQAKIEAMRAVALKNKFADQKIISIKIADVSSPSDSQKKALDSWGGTYSFDVKSFDEKTGQFTTVGNYRKGTGQLNGTRIEFSHPYCNGAFTLADGAVLTGELGCTGNWSGKFEGSINLQ